MAESRARRFGAFEALQLLVGKGGQGRLFAARCLEEGAFEGLHVGDEVVLKAMPVRADDPEKAYRRLARRTAALVAARHPGIVRYYGCFETEGGGIDDAMHVVVMELLRGETLEERLRREPLGLDGADALAILRACLEALVHAASFGIVHRDLKPSNVFLCEDGGVKLIDFEVARQATSAQTTTESGAMQGTFDYMAPDFHPNFRPDPKFRGDQCSDVFSLAVTFHEALAGRRPYAAGTMLGDQSMMAFFQRWTKADGADPRRAIRIDGVRIHALRHLQRVLRKALQPERSARYQTYAEFLAALSRVEPRVLEGGIGRYRLSKCIGKGGFGVVYKAFREGDGAAVAIKVLLRAEYAERFDREGRVLMRFADDRIVTFVEAFSGGDPMSPTHFLVMRYLEGMPGSSLKDRLAADPSRRGLPRSETLAAFVRFAEGLQILHDEGVYHRDVKPANLYFPAGEPERACLMDLGVVRTDETHTNGGLPGTLDYMAPELATGGSRGDASADLYALGLCLYEALTGRTAYPRLPRGSEGVAAFYARARSGEEPDLSGLDGEPELQALVRSMTAVDRSERPASAREAARLLRAVPFREEGPREAIATGTVYSEDTTDDLVLPPVPPPPAVPAPAQPASASVGEEGEGDETRAVPAEAAGETVAAVPDGETAAFPPEGEEEAEPAPDVAAEAEGGGETAVAPEPEPAAVAVDAEAETRAPGEGETAAVAAGGEGETAAGVEGQGETAAAVAEEETQASPTVAAEGELTATAVAETAAVADGGTTTAAVEMTATAATMAAEAGTTTAAMEGFTATAATMATDGETAATAAVEETAATAAFDAAEPPRKEAPAPPPEAAKPAKRPAPGVREIRPASRWRSVAAAACVLLLCGAAAGVFFFQEKLSDWFHGWPGEKPGDDGSKPSLVVSGDDLQQEVNDFVAQKTPDNWSEWDRRREDAENLKERISGSQESDEMDRRLKEWETKAWTEFVGKRVDTIEERIDKEREPEAWKRLKSDTEDEKVKVPVGCQDQYASLLSVLDDKIDENDALVEARRFQNEDIPSDQAARKTRLDEAERHKKESTKWPAVAKAYDTATNRLQAAISAFDAISNQVNNAEKANEFDDLVKAYANLVAANATPGIPADAETMRTNAVAKLKQKLDEQFQSFAEKCGTEKTENDYEKHVTEAERRRDLHGLPQTMRDQYAGLVSRIKAPVTLTIQNENAFPIVVTVGKDKKPIEEKKKGLFEVERWSNQAVDAKAQEWSVDYETWNKPIEIKHASTNERVELKPKPAPSISLSSSNASEKVLQVSLDGKDWHSLPWTFGPDAQLAPRKDYSIQWRINPQSHPEDYKTTDGRIPVTTDNRDSTKNLTIPSPKRMDDPVITFENSGGPAFSVRFTGKSEPGKPMTFTADPRTDVTATFTRNDTRDGNEWFDIASISFRTGNRGWTTNVVVRQERRPEIRVTNESAVSILLDGRTIEADAKESFFGNDEEKRTIFAGPATDSEYSFYKDKQAVPLTFGKAGSTNAVSIRLEIDGEKMKVAERDGRFDMHECFVSWTNQLEQLKDELKQNHQEDDLRTFLTSCDNWMKTAKSDLPKKDMIKFNDIVALSRCLLLERKLAEMIGDEDEKSKVEKEIKGWVKALSGEKLFDASKENETNQLAQAIWAEMDKIAKEGVPR